MILKVIKGCKGYLKVIVCIAVREEIGRLKEGIAEYTHSRPWR